MKIISKSEKDTFKIAKDLTSKLKGGEVLCLIGDLGSGKTAFTKGIAKALKIKNTITSPTFVLMKVYLGDKQLVHIDAYRLRSGNDLEAIGALDYFDDPDTITVIEWAEKVKDIWPKNRKVIEFKVKSENQREIKIK